MNARERLVESTAELLWERGYAGTSPAAIQDLAQVGQGSMYYHFGSKSELVAESVARSVAQLRRNVEGSLRGPGTAFERISRYLACKREVLKGCSVGRLAYDRGVLEDPRLKILIQEAFSWQQQILAEVLAEGKEHGEFSAELDVREAAAMIAATLQGAYVLARAAGDAESFNRAIGGLTAILQAYSAANDSSSGSVSFAEPPASNSSATQMIGM